MSDNINGLNLTDEQWLRLSEIRIRNSRNGRNRITKERSSRKRTDITTGDWRNRGIRMYSTKGMPDGSIFIGDEI